MMLPEAPERAEALRDEFLSVGIPAEHVAPSAFVSQQAVIVQTGTVPPTVHIAVDEGYRWQVSGRTNSHSHGHDLPRRTSASDVVELVALCVAGQCANVPVLQVSRIPGGSTTGAAERKARA
ncbi:hypothetical protein [Streptomyces sp. NPDC052042]|uniref:hypothetical protein n=1 Tax=Streptomyces sp. NPDC052042 TaxID=3365683 RepID=UPI0037D8B4BC